MTVETSRYRGGSLPPPLTWQAISFMRCEWPFLFAGAGRLRTQVYDDPAGHHLVRADGNVLLSYADVVAADGVLAGRPVTVRGLSNVFTFPPYRHEGHASQIVAAAGRQIDESAEDLAVLFCEPRLAGFYAARGWTTAPPGAVLAPSGVPVAMVRAGSPRGHELIGQLSRNPLRLAVSW